MQKLLQCLPGQQYELGVCRVQMQGRTHKEKICGRAHKMLHELCQQQTPAVADGLLTLRTHDSPMTAKQSNRSWLKPASCQCKGLLISLQHSAHMQGWAQRLHSCSRPALGSCRCCQAVSPQPTPSDPVPSLMGWTPKPGQSHLHDPALLCLPHAEEIQTSARVKVGGLTWCMPSLLSSDVYCCPRPPS